MATKEQVNSFISKLSTLAVAEYQKRKKAGRKWVLPSVCIAQSALETGWGTSPLMVKANAFFGIKAGTNWTGKVYSAKTQECYNGRDYTTITDLFRAYDSLEESVADYYNLITGLARYFGACNQENPRTCIQEIKDGDYATDPNYVENVISIINQYNLTKYDKDTKGESMARIEKAVQQMETWANDPAHGYDQTYRWGEKGDYDCSSAIIQACQLAGIPVKAGGATYTGNMYGVFLKNGFKDVTASVNLATGAGLRRGDVLLNHIHHVAMYCGSGKEVEASINEKGAATGGNPGDQTGQEFLIRPYRNYPWNAVLRHEEAGSAPEEKWNATGTATSTVDNLYVRANPNGVILGELMKGNRFEVDGKTSGNWTRVNVAGIGKGWVYTTYIQRDGQTNTVTGIAGKQDKAQRLFVGKVTADELNVRTWAGTGYPNIRSYPVLKRGNLVDVMNFTQKCQNGEKWYYIRIAGQYYGFVHSKYIERQ